MKPKKPEPRCSCVDNRWACEKHNGDRVLADAWHFAGSAGNLCGHGGRNYVNLRQYVDLCEYQPKLVCPTCAIRAKALVMDEDRRVLQLHAEARRLKGQAQELEAVLPPKFDPVEKPKHYNSGKVECIDALESATVTLTGIEAVCTANAIKYLWRWKQKNGVEDLKKAKWYIDRLIKGAQP